MLNFKNHLLNSDFVIHINEVKVAIANLKFGKSDGEEGLYVRLSHRVCCQCNRSSCYIFILLKCRPICTKICLDT